MRALKVFAAAWCVGVAALTVHGHLRASAPGRSAAPTDWPETARVARAADRPTLLLFAHPHCPCTASSIEELARVVARAGDRVAARVLLTRPAGTPPGWEEGTNAALARRIPGVQVHVDLDEHDARAFGALTSGHVLVFAPDGRRAFSGGITGARAEAGDNAGEDAVLALLEGREHAAESPVFGCPTFEEGD